MAEKTRIEFQAKDLVTEKQMALLDRLESGLTKAQASGKIKVLLEKLRGVSS